MWNHHCDVCGGGDWNGCCCPGTDSRKSSTVPYMYMYGYFHSFTAVESAGAAAAGAENGGVPALLTGRTS